MSTVNDFSSNSWKPSATRATLGARAVFLRLIREFFWRREVLEVETPILSAGASVERQIDSLSTLDGRWLSTSPEFAMKRLLASGSGPIFQLGRAFRVDDAARYHNPEFTMLEWYRPGFSLDSLMDEVQALLQALGCAEPFVRLSYREAIRMIAEVDPFDSTCVDLRAALARHGIAQPEGLCAHEMEDRDFWLDLIMGFIVGPQLGRPGPCFVYDYPASQAALARLSPHDARVAERFELYWQGVELANGFHELSDAAEQRRRFEEDQAWRLAQRRMVPPIDERFLSALEAGLPDCSGVALGFDRLVMLLLDLATIAEVVAFDAPRA